MVYSNNYQRRFGDCHYAIYLFLGSNLIQVTHFHNKTSHGVHRMNTEFANFINLFVVF